MEVGYYKWNDISKEEKTIVLGLDIKDGLYGSAKRQIKKVFVDLTTFELDLLLSDFPSCKKYILP